ncbi:MAG: hypothetical protein LH606_02365 [Cytophagaceae bacterium]|nr:hypothetical protein [Cytophagaceae bacterium]
MQKLTSLIIALGLILHQEVVARQTKPTQSGSNTGSPQAGNEKPIGNQIKRQTNQPGRRVNTNTTNNSGSTSRTSMSQGSMKGTDNPGSSGQASQRSRANKGLPKNSELNKNNSGTGRRAQ